MKIESQHKCYGGTVTYYSHQSLVNDCEMGFSVFLPKEAENDKVPVLTYLSGLTCTCDNFTTKAGAYRKASELGIAVIAPDTSPRGDHIPDEKDNDAMGTGAGLYLDATNSPWSKNYNMYSYITKELYNLTLKKLPIDKEKHGIFGHSMGGHGALLLYLKNPDKYKSVSAFAPVCSTTNTQWCRDAFAKYFGDDKELWLENDATEILRKIGSTKNEILIDQGLGDPFLQDNLKPHLFEQACADVGQRLKLRTHDDYDHSYFFVQTFIEDHMEFHNRLL